MFLSSSSSTSQFPTRSQLDQIAREVNPNNNPDLEVYVANGGSRDASRVDFDKFRVAPSTTLLYVIVAYRAELGLHKSVDRLDRWGFLPMKKLNQEVRSRCSDEEVIRLRIEKSWCAFALPHHITIPMQLHESFAIEMPVPDFEIQFWQLEECILRRFLLYQKVVDFNKSGFKKMNWSEEELLTTEGVLADRSSHYCMFSIVATYNGLDKDEVRKTLRRVEESLLFLRLQSMSCHALLQEVHTQPYTNTTSGPLLEVFPVYHQLQCLAFEDCVKILGSSNLENTYVRQGKVYFPMVYVREVLQQHLQKQLRERMEEAVRNYKRHEDAAEEFTHGRLRSVSKQSINLLRLLAAGVTIDEFGLNPSSLPGAANHKPLPFETIKKAAPNCIRDMQSLALNGSVQRHLNFQQRFAYTQYFYAMGWSLTNFTLHMNKAGLNEKEISDTYQSIERKGLRQGLGCRHMMTHGLCPFMKDNKLLTHTETTRALQQCQRGIEKRGVIVKGPAHFTRLVAGV